MADCLNKRFERTKLEAELRIPIMHGDNDPCMKPVCKIPCFKVVYCIDCSYGYKQNIYLADFFYCLVVKMLAEVAAMQYLHTVHLKSVHDIGAAESALHGVMICHETLYLDSSDLKLICGAYQFSAADDRTDIIMVIMIVTDRDSIRLYCRKLKHGLGRKRVGKYSNSVRIGQKKT